MRAAILNIVNNILYCEYSILSDLNSLYKSKKNYIYNVYILISSIIVIILVICYVTYYPIN